MVQYCDMNFTRYLNYMLQYLESINLQLRKIENLTPPLSPPPHPLPYLPATQSISRSSKIFLVFEVFSALINLAFELLIVSI